MGQESGLGELQNSDRMLMGNTGEVVQERFQRIANGHLPPRIPSPSGLQSPSVKAFYCDHFVLPLPDGHRFPMKKYSLLRERVLAVGIVAAWSSSTAGGRDCPWPW
jgi:hypothetical protein